MSDYSQVEINAFITEEQRKRNVRKGNRYQMTNDQPAQIDCRREDCRYYEGAGKCVNVSPAITLNQDGAGRCWSHKEREPQPCPCCGEFSEDARQRVWYEKRIAKELEDIKAQVRGATLYGVPLDLENLEQLVVAVYHIEEMRHLLGTTKVTR